MELGVKLLDLQREGIEKLLPGFVKIQELGYDGKGNKSVDTFEEVVALLNTEYLEDGTTKSQFFKAPCILEKKVDFEYEMSVIVSRDRNGNVII